MKQLDNKLFEVGHFEVPVAKLGLVEFASIIRSQCVLSFSAPTCCTIHHYSVVAFLLLSPKVTCVELVVRLLVSLLFSRVL